MSVIEAVRREREDLARVLKKHTGIRKIVEDLYPDSAHFIYELLQNAEDTHATYAQFVLTEKSLAFEHDGRPFEPLDIEAITDIGEGTKAGDDDKIGRFGVGFKAVFAYSETPHIWSPTFSFKISELVLPDRLDRRPELGNKTRFEFPFDNPKKDPATAFSEIQAGLGELAETTLLFLTHLESISWKIGDNISGDVLRIRHSDYHFEVLKQAGGTTTTSSHFLKFDRPVEGLEKQRVAVAFALDLLPGVEQFEREKPLAKQLRIVPAAPGRVAVFFPAEKETSGLRFHLHAPFVPELSRASIKETPANRPLFQQLATLSATSLHQIRDLDLLTADFLAVLPNPQDPLPDRYKSIREAIVEAMNSEPLTPTHAKGHAPARQLLQAKASLKELLTPEDLEYLVEYEEEPYRWAIGAAQKNSNADRFLAGLAIEDWDIEALVELLSERTSNGFHSTTKPPYYSYEPDEEFMGWLSGKSPEWHQRLYATLYAELSPSGACRDLREANIVRLSNGKYGLGKNCFFPSDEAEQDDVLPRVDRAVYSSGKSKPQQENARRLLEEIGVREVGEGEQIEVLLKQRYRAEDFSPRKKDLRRFVAFVENEPQRARLFANYYIFEGEDGKWHQPGGIYLDRPFLDTGLAAYYGAVGEKAKRYALAESYGRAEVAVKRVAKFAESVGAQTKLVPIEVSCYANPEWSYLTAVGGERYTSSSINRDYTIDAIDMLLASPSIALSKLVWNTMQQLPANYLKATHQKSRSWGARYANSQLVHHLRKAAWVPQEEGNFVRPAEADRDLLPEGFAFDPGWPWLKAIQFGEDEVKRGEARQQRQVLAETLGFADVESMDRAKRFAALPADEQERFLAAVEERRDFELPEHEPSNPERRAERVGKQAQEAPDREFEKRTRSVAVGRAEVKEEASQYLRQQYTNGDGVMICQVCKEGLPFKLDDGTDYFEKVWFLTELEKQHHQNYLALCPNHAAMFQYANGSGEELLGSFLAIGGNELEVVLAQQDASIYFTRTHIADLKAVIESEREDHEDGEDDQDDVAEAG
jgi:hypothetical protein